MTKFFHLLLPLYLLLGACNHTEKHPEENPGSMMTREQAPAATVSDHWTQTDHEHGSFDILVSDYESKQRAIWQKPDMVIAQLGDLSGKTVADIGAGTGYFAFRLTPKAAKVIAIDIDQRFINFMDSIKVRLPEPYQKRFETRLGEPENPHLQPSEADAVIIVNTYAYLDHRIAYLQTLARGMKKGGKLLIIDFKKNNLPIGPSSEFKVSTEQVKAELKQAGFTVESTDVQSLEYQYIVIATPDSSRSDSK